MRRRCRLGFVSSRRYPPARGHRPLVRNSPPLNDSFISSLIISGWVQQGGCLTSGWYTLVRQVLKPKVDHIRTILIRTAVSFAMRVKRHDNDNHRKQNQQDNDRLIVAITPSRPPTPPACRSLHKCLPPQSGGDTSRPPTKSREAKRHVAHASAACAYLVRWLAIFHQWRGRDAARESLSHAPEVPPRLR